MIQFFNGVKWIDNRVDKVPDTVVEWDRDIWREANSFYREAFRGDMFTVREVDGYRMLMAEVWRRKVATSHNYNHLNKLKIDHNFFSGQFQIENCDGCYNLWLIPNGCNSKCVFFLRYPTLRERCEQLLTTFEKKCGINNVLLELKTQKLLADKLVKSVYLDVEGNEYPAEKPDEIKERTYRQIIERVEDILR